MLNSKGIIVGTLLYMVVEVVLFIRAIPPKPPGLTGGVVGYDLVTYIHNHISGPMFLVSVIVFWYLGSRFFPR
jgi:hypothetical protein